MPDSVTESAGFPPAAFLTAEQLGGAKTIGRQVQSEADLARAVELGFPTATIDALRKRGVTEKRSRLTMEESDRAVRLARVRALAEGTFADRHKADRWLHQELTALDGRRPIDLIRTQVGARMVEGLLASIAWGAAL